jgi:hypothetical protein
MLIAAVEQPPKPRDCEFHHRPFFKSSDLASDFATRYRQISLDFSAL